jgi:hypothetical protein
MITGECGTSPNYWSPLGNPAFGAFLKIRRQSFQGQNTGSNPVGDARFDWSIPDTWVTVHSEHIGNISNDVGRVKP